MADEDFARRMAQEFGGGWPFDEVEGEDPIHRMAREVALEVIILTGDTELARAIVIMVGQKFLALEKQLGGGV